MYACMYTYIYASIAAPCQLNANKQNRQSLSSQKDSSKRQLQAQRPHWRSLFASNPCHVLYQVRITKY